MGSALPPRPFQADADPARLVNPPAGQDQAQRRVIITSENHAGQAPWLIGSYDLMQETPTPSTAQRNSIATPTAARRRTRCSWSIIGYARPGHPIRSRPPRRTRKQNSPAGSSNAFKYGADCRTSWRSTSSVSATPPTSATPSTRRSPAHRGGRTETSAIESCARIRPPPTRRSSSSTISPSCHDQRRPGQEAARPSRRNLETRPYDHAGDLRDEGRQRDRRPVHRLHVRIVPSPKPS